ncbi:hypothetical protein [Robiginitalea sp. SC105]|uniref:hypothetical protein n=1 Tax=Robiginitalea sp. SC105 TaxID=2762332 RepID=UPI001639E0DC|nr:hypothetical protein [Robiginitalea sp. SC105]MBC2839770.1 hypothetical protein [Robiginitalea sp. SC105]
MELLDTLWEYSFFGLYAGVLAMAVIRFSRYYDTPARYLPILLAYTLVTEAIGIIVRDYEEFSIVIKELYYNNNWLIYNVYAIVLIGFFYYLYHAYIVAFRITWLKAGGLGLFIAVSIWNAWQYDFATVSQVFAYGVGGLLLIVLSALYLLQEYRFAIRNQLKYNLLVWLSLGLLLFNLGYVPVNYLRFLVAAGVMEYPAWIRPLHLGLIYGMYGCFLLGFLLMKKLRQPGNYGSNGNGFSGNGFNRSEGKGPE